MSCLFPLRGGVSTFLSATGLCPYLLSSAACYHLVRLQHWSISPSSENAMGESMQPHTARLGLKAYSVTHFPRCHGHCHLADPRCLVLLYLHLWSRRISPYIRCRRRGTFSILTEKSTSYSTFVFQTSLTLTAERASGHASVRQQAKHRTGACTGGIVLLSVSAPHKAT